MHYGIVVTLIQYLSKSDEFDNACQVDEVIDGGHIHVPVSVFPVMLLPLLHRLST